MKNLCVLLTLILCMLAVSTVAQTVTIEQAIVVNESLPDPTPIAPTDDEIRAMNIFDACKALGVSPVYNERYDAIIMPLCAAGVIMFPASSNPYSDPKSDGATRALITEYNGPEYADCYWYVGTGPQNATLIRNMVANKHLIKNGKLVPGAAKKWKVVK